MAVIITGGTGAIGSALTEAFAKDYDVAVIYKASDAKAAELEKTYGCKCFKADITSQPQAHQAVERIYEQFGKIDILINNAGISQIKLFTDITETDWQDMLNIHLTGMFNVTQAAVKHMLTRKQGSIVNVSSVWGVHGASCEVHYSTAKAGIIGFTKALSKELAPSGITVNCAAPGVIDSPMNRKDLTPEELAELEHEIPLGRQGTPQEIAQSIKFLAESRYITGQVLGIDGGFY
ncbi:MAG: 3-oxoacyl-ACP reductase FabG [Eubacterium sp.]|nr:3-oxoacyl-ACP reductase FabG [Eubacterium sp.]